MNDTENSLASMLGPEALVTDASARERYVHDWTGKLSGDPVAIVRPSSTEEVARCVQWCAQNNLAIVPQGGNTGLAGGATPAGARSQVILSLERMNRILHIDPVSNSITAQAGVILHDLQAAATSINRFFPLSLGSEGSCQVGGCIASNAGGTAVVRYGNMRELVLGLEVVLPDGRVWSRLRALRKDNAGFDLKHLFIGTEGTLGIVTAATLRLFPQQRQSVVAMVGLADPAAVIDLFVLVRDEFDAGVTGFEFMTGAALRMACVHLDQAVPLAGEFQYAVLLELSTSRHDAAFADAVYECLSGESEAGRIGDVSIASSEQQARRLWTLRESIPPAMLHAWPRVSVHDVALPISKIPAFIAQVDAKVGAEWPQMQTVLFGHVGDGNLHLNFVAPGSMAPDDFAMAQAAATDFAYRLVVDHGGSISAEHGIGTQKLEPFVQLESPAHLALMRTLKAALDGSNVLNPGKVIPD